jgi:hypothetical protein
MFELLSLIGLSLWLALSSCPVALTHCCCSIDPCLARCRDIPPDEATVTIAGIINGTYCTLCDGYNTTYILQNCAGANGLPNNCSYGCVNGNGYFNGPCNGIPPGYIEPPHIFDTITVDIASGIVGHTTLQVYMTLQNLDLYIWRSDDLGVSPINCQPLGPVNCHYFSGPASDGVSGVGSPFGPWKCDTDESDVTVTL